MKLEFSKVRLRYGKGAAVRYSQIYLGSEIEHHLWLDAICQNQNLGKKTCWQKKSCWQTKGNVDMAEWTKSTSQQPSPYRYIKWSSTVQACSYRYYLMKNNIEWTISVPTSSPCEVSLFELAVISTILSVMKNSKTLALANFENFAQGEKLDENENQKMKQKIQIQVT